MDPDLFFKYMWTAALNCQAHYRICYCKPATELIDQIISCENTYNNYIIYVLLRHLTVCIIRTVSTSKLIVTNRGMNQIYSFKLCVMENCYKIY